MSEQFEKVLDYFRLISSVPHGSSNTSLISDLISDFAVSNKLRYIKDSLGNVIIFKDGTPGYETAEPVIIQGHLDMVCVKESDCETDLQKSGLTLVQNGDFLFAKGTSLGADDGIAVAFALCILASENIAHPPLEVVFTVDEEIGMLGADKIDLSPLRGKMMINIDSEEEDTMLVSCAGGVRADAKLALSFLPCDESGFEIKLSGLTGGHSGTEIDKGRLNAVTTLASLLCKVPCRLCSINGGSADNAIASSCTAEVILKSEEEKKKLEAELRALKEKSPADPEMKIEFKKIKADFALSEFETQKVLSCLCNIPNGVVAFSKEIEALVETSLNLGICKTENNELTLCHALRSSVSKSKRELCEKLKAYYASFGATLSFFGDYPAWEFQKNSRLQKVFERVFEKRNGKKLQVSAVHAGLECGIFCNKIEGLDCVSIGPNIFDIHTTDEKLSISSAEREFGLFCDVLSNLI